MRILITEEASTALQRGIARRRNEIHFPKKINVLLKILACLPRSLWCRLAQGMVKV